ncbi:MAG: hypothetical protein ACOVP7_06480 [Lacibacter sp.]
MEKRKDFTSKDMATRIKEGMDKWEPFVISELEKHNIIIKPSSGREDMLNKIDGWLNKEPVQIKIRNTSVKNRNDFSFELVQNFNPQISLRKLTNSIENKGRDWKCSAKHYFVLNKESNIIYHLDGVKIKKEINLAIDEIEDEDFDLSEDSFVSEKSLEIKATIDKDRNSHTPSKVMVFIPIKLVLINEYII